jgi:hypothetical protein
MKHQLIAAALWLTAINAAAVPVQCAEDKRTNAMFCIAPSELREANGIRSAPLFTGGPNGVERSDFTVATNCATGVLHLKDRRGVSFGGSSVGDDTQQSRDLRRLVCDTPLPTPKKKKS